jgi:GNAT superfamily N-acetyltransferase
MLPSDLSEVDVIAAEVHPAHPEEIAVPTERLRLYPHGCFVLDGGGTILGYAVSHPWRVGDPPSLNTLIGAIPSPPETYYVHDVALLPAARGRGYSHEIVRRLVAEAANAGQTTISLVAIRDSVAIWKRHGFKAVHDPARAEKLRSYGAGATLMIKDLCAPSDGRKVAAPGEGT